ncbi:MAG: hypothetical protein V4640_04875 [Verrucomicrobiota bacterium]
MKTHSALALALPVASVLFSHSAAAAETGVSVRCLAFQQGFPTELHAHNADGNTTAGMVEIKAYLNHEGATLKSKAGALVFTASMRPSSATDVNEVVGQVQIPAKLASAILIFLPETRDAKPPKCQVVAVDDSSKAFPGGSFKVVNASDSAAKVDLGGDVTEIPAGESKLISKVKYAAGDSVSMTAYTKSGEAWVNVSNGSWMNPGDKRVLQVFYKDAGADRVVLKGIRDVTTP